MSKLSGEVLTLPKMSGSVSTSKSLSGNVGAKTINIGGKGDDGATFIPSVSADGVISWTNDKELPNPEPVNIKGAKGDTGATGPQGPPGSDASVTAENIKKALNYTPADQKDVSRLSKEIVDIKSEYLQQAPLFAQTIEECIDTTKLYVLPDGYIYAYSLTKEEVFADVLSKVGYTDNMRINSSGGIVPWAYQETNHADITGYIPCKAGDIIRVKNMPIPDTFTSGTYWNNVASFDANKNYISQFALFTRADDSNAAYNRVIEDGNVVQFTVAPSLLGENIAYIAINAKDITDESEVYVNSEIKTVYEWKNTGIAFVSSDYADEIADHEARLKLLEATEGENEIPEYWLSELETKADAIQVAMETAGRNKSAFLWYTDAHWQTNSKMSPALLNYLAKNTLINKVNFGGDIINDPAEFTHDNIKYAYEWRKLIANLPNHHSVYGNHDVNHRTTDVSNMSYALLLADEEMSDMVVGGDSYYYIDNPSEKTRYLYLSYLTNNHDEMVAQGQFIVDAIKSAQDGWHIVVIAHRWFQYAASSTPAVGSIPTYESEILNIFDAYNARSTHAASNYFYKQDFSDCKGKVEFCIGGHIHVDYDFTSTGGIPVIITTADANQNRVPDSIVDSGTIGTITESAVFGIIADYDNSKITVVGVGRGTSREITLS